MKMTINPNALDDLNNKKYPDILSVQEAREILGIGRVSVYHLIESGQLQAFGFMVIFI